MSQGHSVVKVTHDLGKKLGGVNQRSSRWEIRGCRISVLVFAALLIGSLTSTVDVYGQAAGAAGTIAGTVTDPDGAAVPGASAILENSGTGYKRATTTDEAGEFRFENVPQNKYQLTVTANGFSAARQMVEVRSAVPIVLKIPLAITGVSATVTVTGSELENVPSAHTDVGEALISRLPPGSPGGGLNDTVANTTPA